MLWLLRKAKLSRAQFSRKCRDRILSDRLGSIVSYCIIECRCAGTRDFIATLHFSIPRYDIFNIQTNVTVSNIWIFFFLFVVPCVFVPFLKIGKYTNNDNIDWNLKNRCSQERRIKKRVISLWAKSTQISHIYPRIRYESLQCSATSDFRWERCSVFIISYT